MVGSIPNINNGKYCLQMARYAMNGVKSPTILPELFVKLITALLISEGNSSAVKTQIVVKAPLINVLLIITRMRVVIVLSVIRIDRNYQTLGTNSQGTVLSLHYRLQAQILWVLSCHCTMVQDTKTKVDCYISLLHLDILVFLYCTIML